MNIALINNNKVENIIVADSLDFANELGFDEVINTEGIAIGIGWERQGGIFVDPFSTPSEIILSTTLTPLEFINRFTDDEGKSILLLSRTNLDVELWWIKYNKATYINLNDPQTIAGVQALEQSGIIGPGRAVEILKVD